jgi:hypothetical protein
MLATNVARLEDNGGHFVSTRYGIIHQACSYELAGIRIVDRALQERLADALHGAAMDLPSQEQRIERGYSVPRGAESPI